MSTSPKRIIIGTTNRSRKNLYNRGGPARRKGTFIATVALLIAIAGAIVAFAAYFKRRSCALCDDLDDEFGDSDLYDMDYYATQVDDAQPHSDEQDAGDTANVLADDDIPDEE